MYKKAVTTLKSIAVILGILCFFGSIVIWDSVSKVAGSAMGTAVGLTEMILCGVIAILIYTAAAVVDLLSDMRGKLLEAEDARAQAEAERITREQAQAESERIRAQRAIAKEQAEAEGADWIEPEDLGEKIFPIVIDDHTVECPFCHTKQNSRLSSCKNCGIDFATKEKEV